MSRPGITYQEVVNAIAHIQGQNENPTVDRIRDFLGTGSKSTIARYLKEWKSKSSHIMKPEGIPQELIALVKSLWERLSSEADEKILLYKQEIELEITEIQQNLTLQTNQNIELTAVTQQLEEKLRQKNKLADDLQQSLEAEKRTNAKLSERNDRITQQLTDQKLETERLHQLLSHVQTNLEHYQASIQKLRNDQILSAEKQKTAHEQEINYLKQTLANELQEKNQLHKNNESVNTELKLRIQQSDTLNKEKILLQEQLQEKILKESELQQSYNQLGQSIKHFQTKIEEQSQATIDFEKKLAASSDQVIYLQKIYHEAQNKIHSLYDEKIFITKEKACLEAKLQEMSSSKHATLTI